MGYPLRFISRHSHKLLNGIPLIWAEPIRWVHRLFHCASKTSSSVVTSIRVHPLLHQNIFGIKRHLSSGRCRYCFLETQPRFLINYIRRKKTLWSRKVSFLETLFFSRILIGEKDFRSTLCFAPKVLVTKINGLGSETPERSSFS